VRKTLFWLGWFTGIAYLIIGVVGGVLPQHWEEATLSDQLIWTALLVGAGVAVLAGLRLIDRSRWAGAALISVGAVVGALPIFWTGLVLLVAPALVVLSMLQARRLAAQPAAG
jgi:ABC-type antimicrobial peptide transport system permease subunit